MAGRPAAEAADRIEATDFTSVTASSHVNGTSPFEAAYGFSRALRVGDRILVSGTAPVEADGSSTPGDAAAQARRCFTIILQAIEQLGGSADDVIRTRMYITNPADADAVGAIHGEIFADIRPAATMVVVAALLRQEWRVEIEAEALVTSRE
jgi:enamine deaminase RidA (YjgF/YER057c/UK114 family)